MEKNGTRKISSNEFIEAEVMDSKKVNFLNHDHFELNEDENVWVNTLLQGSFESSSYYYFHKILSSPDYIIGKKTHNFIEEFFNKFKNVEQASILIPLPVNFN